jgi:hypothetical protein
MPPGSSDAFESLDHVKVDGAQGTADLARTKRYGIRLRWHFVTLCVPPESKCSDFGLRGHPARHPQ